MHIFYSNGMFILALVAVSILGVICLGLLIVLALVVLQKKQGNGTQVNLSGTEDSPSPNPSHPNAEKAQLTVSDRVSILTSEKFGLTGIVLGVSSVLIALVALIYTAIRITSYGYIPVAIIVAALLYSYLKTIKPLQKRTKDANEILKTIINGDLNSSEDIYKAWRKKQKPKEEN